MAWKKHTLKIGLLIFSITSVLLASAPDNACAADPADAGKLASIESVVSAGEGAATAIIVKLTSPAIYTSYKTSLPLRLVIDFSQTTEGNISAPIAINRGNFKTVTASRYDTGAGVLTRMEIMLVKDSEALISPLPGNPGELKITFPALAEKPVAAVKTPAVAPPATPSVPVPVASVSTAEVGNEVPLSTLTAISVKNNTITLAIDGATSEFKAFRLNKPERFVIDLSNTKSGLSSRLLPLNISGVASARIGINPGKVRIVFDAVNGNFPEAVAVKSGSGVVITLGSTPVAADPVPVKTEKPVVPAKAVVQTPPAKQPTPISSKTGGPSTVEMIDFQVVDGLSRVSVKVTGEVQAEQPVRTAGYVTLTIKNTTLPKNLQRSLETRSFVSPVLRVTPLAVTTKKSTDTKIRIATRVTAPFEFRREGDMLYMDFKHPEGLSRDTLNLDNIDQTGRPAVQKPAPARDGEISADLSAPVPDAGDKSLSSVRSYKGRKVTLEFADAEVRKIFQLLSEVSNKNFVLGDEVTGTISLKLVNVPWDQALDIILDTKGLDKRENGNIILIKGKGKFKSQAEEDLDFKKTAAKSIELKTETFLVNYADLTAITSQFERLKTAERGQISSDTRTNKVIVKDTPQALSEMRALLSQLDLPEKQVMIEARIVEATSTFTRNLGVNWGIHNRDGSASFFGINQLDTAFGGVAAVAPTTGTASTAGGAMGISFGRLTSNISLDLRLSASAGAGLIKIVSTPKVATLNNKTAKITQGQQIPYQAVDKNGNPDTKFVEAALALEVTPHINANGTISMKIDAKNDSPGTSSGGTAPPINKKQATTEMLLRDGETTVIGGIYIDDDKESNDGVPFMMDIPFLGNLFKSSAKSKVKTELLIFITPRILN